MGGNRRYAVTGISEAASVRTSVNLFSAGTAKPEVYDIVVGCSGVAADGVAVIKVWRSTGVGTEGAGVTPRGLDPDAPVSLCDAGETHSVEPTYTASSELIEIALNQRATFRWVAAPGSELVGAGTSNNGIGIQHTGVTLTYESTMLFQEYGVAGDKTNTVRRPSGWSIVTDPDGQTEEVDTVMCCHCGKHWAVRPGSGKVRGFCFKCNGPICGPKCETCYPRHQQIEDMSNGIIIPR